MVKKYGRGSWRVQGISIIARAQHIATATNIKLAPAASGERAAGAVW